MRDFVLIDAEYPKVPSLLLGHVQGFADSLEYERLNQTERRLPGVVAAAFSRFLVRFQDAELRDGLTERDAKTLDDVYRAIETLACSRDEQVRTLIRHEIFENIRAGESLWCTIEGRLGPQSRDQLEKWREKSASSKTTA